MKMRVLLAGAVLALALMFPAAAQQKSASMAGFDTDRLRGATILFMRPDIKVGERSTAGLFEPDRAMTDDARRNLTASLRQRKQELGLNFLEEEAVLGGASEAELAQYRALFKAIAEAVVEFQFFPGNRLPTKRANKSLDYSVGPGLGALAADTGADFALFVLTEDHYASAGRKVASVLAAGLFGAYVPTGLHIGYAGLVDLRTGDLVWINADVQMGGDPREEAGADKRSRQLLEGLPAGQPVAAAR